MSSGKFLRADLAPDTVICSAEASGLRACTGPSSILGFAIAAEQSYVWLVASIIQDSRLVELPTKANTLSVTNSEAETQEVPLSKSHGAV